MARPNAPRNVDGESNLAQRVRMEREARGWSYDTLARQMTSIGCSINGSALFRVEKGQPPRRITVDELVAFARVFGVSAENLLTPVEVLREERATELLQELKAASRELGHVCARLSNSFLQYLELAEHDKELWEYVNGPLKGDIAEYASGLTPMLDVTDDDGETLPPVHDSTLRAGVQRLSQTLFEIAEQVFQTGKERKRHGKHQETS